MSATEERRRRRERKTKSLCSRTQGTSPIHEGRIVGEGDDGDALPSKRRHPVNRLAIGLNPDALVERLKGAAWKQLPIMASSEIAQDNLVRPPVAGGIAVRLGAELGVQL